jgi:DNA-binding transcriptional LysR family regulator
MEIRQLRYLVLLAEELSFTRAAARGNVAQPALSRQIQRLEDEFGTALVDRTSRRVRMTPAGESLVERAAHILQELEDARADIAGTKQLVSGDVSLGITQTPGPLRVAELLRAFHARHPSIELRVREELSVAIADWLRSDAVELGLISRVPERAQQGLTLELIAREPLVTIVGPEHRLASVDEIEFDELRGESLVLFPPSATIRRTVDELVEEHGLASRVPFETSDTARMRELVSIGLGVAFLPLSDARTGGPRVKILGIRDHALDYELFLARRSRRRIAPASSAMVRLITEGKFSSRASQRQRLGGGA